MPLGLPAPPESTLASRPHQLYSLELSAYFFQLPEQTTLALPPRLANPSVQRIMFLRPILWDSSCSQGTEYPHESHFPIA